MGKKKKFIDKKKSATFQLLAQDSADLNPLDPSSSADRVFVRVDRNPYFARGFQDPDPDPLHDSDSIFADAPGDDDPHDLRTTNFVAPTGGVTAAAGSGSFSEEVRREILELGLPDDGYNYLLHLREIKSFGAGSTYYHNSKAKLGLVPHDVKAFDASRLQIHLQNDDDLNTKSIYSVASLSVGMKIQTAVDPDVAALLEDGDLSLFGSDVEDLDEDFVLKANLLDEEEELGTEEKVEMHDHDSTGCGQVDAADSFSHAFVSEYHEAAIRRELVNEKPRVQRLLDDQFDLLTAREYDTDAECYESYDAVASEEECLAAKLNHVLKDHVIDDLDINDKYRVPGDFMRGNEESVTGGLEDAPADVICKCAEYAAMYENESDHDEGLVVVQESSDESEIWDCETIVSTYSNLDNHPGKIAALENPKKKFFLPISGASDDKSNMITLQGKEKLPVDFLPHNRRAAEKVKKVANVTADKKMRRPQGESNEEKKEHKTALKEERREARRAKKEMKGLYRCEAQRAQKAAAISWPSSIHLM